MPSCRTVHPRAARARAASAIKSQTVTFLLPRSDGAAMRKIGGEPTKRRSMTPYSRPTRRPSAREIIYTLLDEDLSDQEALQKLKFEESEDRTLIPYKAPASESVQNHATLIVHPVELKAQGQSAVWSSRTTVAASSSVQLAPSSSEAELASGFNALQLSGTSSSAPGQWWDIEMEEDDGGLPEDYNMDVSAHA